MGNINKLKGGMKMQYVQRLVINKLKKDKQLQKVMALTAIATMLLMSVCFASTPPPSLTLNFDFTTMFSWAQNILNVMMPVVYITMGVSLAFIIIRALKSAFS